MKLILKCVILSPLALAGLILWMFLLWNEATANGTSSWKAFKSLWKINNSSKLLYKL